MVGDLELEGSDLTVAPLEAGKEAGTSEAAAKEVLPDRGLEVGAHEAVEVDEDVRRLARHIRPL